MIILLDLSNIPSEIRSKIDGSKYNIDSPQSIDRDIQLTFSEEWKTYNEILPEHNEEFYQYFDTVDINKLHSKCVCDMGCGIGRWAYFLKDIVGEIVLVDFSESIFEARKNLANAKNAIFIMGDVLNLPFRDNAFDFVYSLGVLHHTSEPALQSVRYLSRFSPELLIYLYYNLDNRGLIYKQIFKMVNVIRVLLSNITSSHARTVLTELLMWLLYLPPIAFGKLLYKISINPVKIPLYPFYSNMSLSRIRQDVYDRFFTSIEQRVSKQEILELSDTFSEIVISDEVPYWHFLCKK